MGASTNEDEKFINSDRFAYTLIGWNVVLTLLLLVVIVTMLCVCGAVERNKKDRHRYDVEEERMMRQLARARVSSATSGKDGGHYMSSGTQASSYMSSLRQHDPVAAFEATAGLNDLDSSELGRPHSNINPQSLSRRNY